MRINKLKLILLAGVFVASAGVMAEKLYYEGDIHTFDSGEQQQLIEGEWKVIHVPWDTSPGFNWSKITQNDAYTKEAHKYAEEIIPGITDIVDIKTGNVDQHACACGGWYQGRTINGVDKYRIVISEHAFMSGWVGGSYDWGYGYKPEGYKNVAHELAHHLNFVENQYDADTHGMRFKHFAQDLIPEELHHLEEKYNYGNGDANFDKNIDY